MSVRIEAMQPEHADAVRRVFQEGIDTGLATFETEAPAPAAWALRFLPQPRLVALGPDGELLGWAALSAVSTRHAYRGVAEVSVYVGAAVRGRGVGRALLAALVTASEGAGFWTLQATIFPENGVSVRLHERAGFRLVGRRCRIAQLHGEWRDTVLLERRSETVGSEHR